MKLLKQGEANMALGFTVMGGWAYQGVHAYKTPMRDLQSCFFLGIF